MRDAVLSLQNCQGVRPSAMRRDVMRSLKSR
jgi:hypothetical protein